MAAAIDAIVTQPGSETYRLVTVVAHFAGLRQSEVVMRRVRSAELPPDGWGRIEVAEADISFDELGEPKTGPRSVPIPPMLVAMVREWIEQDDVTAPERLLFRTRKDTRPSGSNSARAWHRALASVVQKPTRLRLPPPPGYAPECRSPKQRDDSDTASKHSSPPTSAPSTTKNTPPTNESTPTSNQTYGRLTPPFSDNATERPRVPFARR